MSLRTAKRMGATLALTLGLLLTLAGVAIAKTWTVTTTADSSFGSCTAAGCSLRDAVTAANADTGDTIVIPANSSHYLLNNELFITSSMTIQGAGASSSVIDAQDKSRVFETDPGASGTVTFSGITITGGSATGGLDGGGVAGDFGNLVLANDVLSNNRNDSTSGDNGGAAIFAGGSNLTVTNTTLSGNSVIANSAGSGFNGGGAIYFSPVSSSSVASLTGDHVTGNSVTANNDQNGFNGGGGIYVGAGSLTLTGTTVNGNSVSESNAINNINGGGGIFLNDGTGVANVIQSTVSDNTVSASGNAFGSNGGGGILSSGSTLVLDQTTVAGNTATVSDTNEEDGGGGVLYAGSAGVIINATTISGNAADVSGAGIIDSGGGGVLDNGVKGSTYTDSTIANNTTDIPAGSNDGGGGLFADNTASLDLTSVTVAGNSSSLAPGGGVFSTFFPISIKSSIIAQNTAGSGGANCGGGGGVSSAGYNLEDADTCNFNAPTDRIDTNPDLGPLASNGGPTQTRALLNGSPAIDAIPLASCTDQSSTPLTLDQRLFPIPDDGEDSCDIGAYQSQEGTALSSQVKDAATNAAWSGNETAGARAYDTATVPAKNGVKPTGTITYTLFSGDTCSGKPLSAQQVTLTGGDVPNSSPTTGLDGSGAYSYSVSYSGDGNYQATTAACESFNLLETIPHISGQAKVGKKLRESPASGVNNPSSIAIQWLRCNRQHRHCKAIHGATARTYKLKAADAGHTVAVRETVTNGGGSSSLQSAPTMPVTFVVSIVDVHGLAVNLRCKATKRTHCPITLELARKRVVLGLAHGTLKGGRAKAVSATLNKHGRHALASRLKVKLLVLEWGVTVARQTLTL